ncbi:MAG TPA: LuxR C-terminal-related transcriptional regulator [Stenomitos sp.]
MTDRELEILELMAQGVNNRKITQARFWAEHTVKNYVTYILSRLGLCDRTQAALLAYEVFTITQSS